MLRLRPRRYPQAHIRRKDRAEALNAVTPGNYEFIIGLARPLEIQAIGEQAHSVQQTDFCRPLIGKD